MLPETITAADFETCLHKVFQVYPEGMNPVAVTLIEVKSFKGPASREGNTAFSALFHATEGTVLKQNIYRIESDLIDSMEVFLVPVGPDSELGGMCYEAVFN